MKLSYYSKKTALVIGASEGIGKAIAEQLMGCGANVIICSRSASKLEASLKDIETKRQTKEQRLESFVLDIRNYQETERVINKLVRRVGCPDYLINCAGFARPGYLNDLDISHYKEMIELNYFGIVNTCKSILPHFIKRNSGHIVNTSSIAGFIGLFGYTGYSASKFAVVGFSEALARELKPFNIDVSVLCPPNTRTPGLEAENAFKPKEVLATEERVRVIDPSAVAASLLKALPKKKFWIIPTFDGNVAHFLSRYFPKILSVFVRRPQI